MKWVIFGLFAFGALWEVAAYLGYRQDQRKHQSADVAMGNMIPMGIGFVLWALDAAIVVCWALYRLMFT